jgi:predicted phage tail protein
VSSGGDDDSVTSNPATLTVDASQSTLSASKTSLDFSNVNVGVRSSLPVTFTNTGNSEITISDVVIAGAGYTASGVQSGQILAPGQTGTLNIIFDPSGTGSLSGSLAVTSNAANSPARVALTGTGVQAAVQHSATLSWVDSDSTVAGYNVYRSTVSGGPYAKLDSALVAATTSTDTAVQAGQTYFYVVTSVDTSGLESAYSSETSATIP